MEIFLRVSMSNSLKHPVRTEVQTFKPYSPGLSIEEIKKKYNLSRVIKMASNENPLGASPMVQEVISQNASMVFRYPRANNPELCRSVAGFLDLDAASIVCGNGSDELIDLLIRLLAVPGQDNIAAFKPCFSIYQLQAMLSGVEFRQARLNNDFSFAWDELKDIVDEQTRLVFLTNPDNPSGYAATAGEIIQFCAGLPEGSFLVVDEAYVDFADPVEEYSVLPFWKKTPNLIILRTFSKMYGLAGLRLGYAVLPEILADYLRRIRLPFSVNILADMAGQAALEDQDFVRKTRSVNFEGRAYLSAGLKDLGCEVYPSQTNFLMFDPPGNAAEIFDALLHQGVIIRPLDSYGFNDLLRVSIGTAEENRLFIQCMREIIS